MTGYVRERLHFSRPVTPLFATTILPAAQRGYAAASAAQGGGAGAIELRVFDHHVYTAWSPLDAPAAPERALPEHVAHWESGFLPEAEQIILDIGALLDPRVPDRRAVGEWDALDRKLARLYALHYEVGQTMRGACAGFAGFLAARGDEGARTSVETLLAPTASLLSEIDAWLAALGGHDPASTTFWERVRDRPTRIDLDAPTWREAPALAERSVRAADGAGHAAGHARAMERRRTAEAQALARFSEEELPIFSMLLDALRRGRSAQQTLNFLAGELAVGATRGVALRAGARIGVGEDVVWMERQEVADALAGSPVDMKCVRARQRSFARALESVPPEVIGTPDPQMLAPDILRMLGVAPANADRGLGASPGVAVGTARVVATEHDIERVQTGDIVIVEALEPSWTPVMQRAAGIVAETGGMLCHAAMVAREMGKPAVVGAANARERYRSGARIKIDGASGEVAIEEKEFST